jgi:hypothetical protein
MTDRETDRTFFMIAAIGGIIIGPTYGDLMGG